MYGNHSGTLVKRKLISSTMDIEEIVLECPEAIRYLKERGIKCIACGEPVWGTLEQVAAKKGFSGKEIGRFVADLNTFCNISTSTQQTRS